MSIDPKAVTDGAFITAAVSAPAWAPWLVDVNFVLSTLTLIVGLAFGVVRLIAFMKDRQKHDHTN